MGHVHTLPPDSPSKNGGGHTHHDPEDPMVENTRGGPSPYESLHTPFQTAQEQSTARLASKPSPHLPIQKTHSPSHWGRCPYVPGRPCPTLTYLQTPRRGHGHPKIPTWAILYREVGLKVWPCPFGYMPTMRPPRLMHPCCGRMPRPHRPHH